MSAAPDDMDFDARAVAWMRINVLAPAEDPTALSFHTSTFVGEGQRDLHMRSLAHAALLTIIRSHGHDAVLAMVRDRAAMVKTEVQAVPP